jgi:hypothetical protein
MDIGEPKPSTKPTARVPSPSPFEASAKMLNSLLEPAEGEFHISAPVVSKVIEEVEQPKSPGLTHKERVYERRHSGIKSWEITPISPTVRVSTPMRVPFTPTRLTTPSKVVVTPVSYLVTVQGINQGLQKDPESPFEISAPGVGRIARKGTPHPHVAETLVDILAWDRSQSQTWEETKHITLAHSSIGFTDKFNPSPSREEDNQSELEYSSIPGGQPDPLDRTIEEITQDEIESPNPNSIPHHNTEESNANSSTQSTDHTLVEPDEEILFRRPYLVRDPYGDEEAEDADMYYDWDWQFPDSIRHKHKYVFGKALGMHWNPRFPENAHHEYYPIPVDPGDIDNAHLPAYIPCARAPTRQELNAQEQREQEKEEQEQERVNWSSRRPEPTRDTSPHLDRESRNAARSASRGAHWRRSMAENDRTWEPEDATKGKSWQNLVRDSFGVLSLGFGGVC